MTGLTMRIEIDDGEVSAALDALIAKGGDLTPAMDEIGGAIVASTQLRFERGEDPDGNPWKPSIRALATGGKTLLDTGRLVSSIEHAAGPDYVDIGTNVIYAAIHQFGGKAGRGLAVEMPVRAYLGIDEDDRAEIGDILADFLLGGD